MEVVPPFDPGEAKERQFWLCCTIISECADCRGLSMELSALEEMQTTRLAAEAERRDLVMHLAQQEGMWL